VAVQSVPLLQFNRVSRRFAGVPALSEIDLEVHPGEVHAIVGENGAGKSTLLNLIAGVLAPDEGTIRIAGTAVRLTDPQAARHWGIAICHQEPDVFEELSLAESIALCRGLPTRAGGVDWPRIWIQARQILEDLGESLDPRQPACELSVAQRQLVQLATALSLEPKLLLLDEPTSSLSVRESEWLFSQLAERQKRGVGIIYISHRLEEIERLATRVTILRDGRVAWSGRAGELSRAEMIARMVGRETNLIPRQAGSIGAPAVLRGIGMHDAGGRFQDISFSVRAGEVLGVYGLVGAGRSEWAQALVGLRTLSRGELSIGDVPYHPQDPNQARQVGLAYLPEDRLRQGIFPSLSIRHNLGISSLGRWIRRGLISRRHERRDAVSLCDRLGVRRRSIEQPIRELSGGNQQKVMLGRCSLADPQVLLLDEPTRGVDVAARQEIHDWIGEATRRGVGVVLVSSELPEVLQYSDRILVFREGELAGTFETRQTSAEELARAALPNEKVGSNPVISGAVHRPSRLGGLAPLVGTLLGLGVLLAATTRGRFTSPENLLGLLEKISVSGLLAMGASVVMLVRGIDISVGSLCALSAASAGLILSGSDGSPGRLLFAIGVGLLVGLCGGLFNAGASLWGRIQPIVVTLGTLTVFRGLLLQLTGGNAVTKLPSAFRQGVTARWLGLPAGVWWLAFALLLMSLFLVGTVPGRWLYAWGSNPRAARLAGIPQTQTWLVAGGRGTPWGAVLGALLLAMLQNGLVLWGVSQFRYELVLGALLVGAMIWERLARRVSP
jgi:rhamnose transport system ATP-binding protein